MYGFVRAVSLHSPLGISFNSLLGQTGNHSSMLFSFFSLIIIISFFVAPPWYLSRHPSNHSILSMSPLSLSMSIAIRECWAKLLLHFLGGHEMPRWPWGIELVLVRCCRSDLAGHGDEFSSTPHLNLSQQSEDSFSVWDLGEEWPRGYWRLLIPWMEMARSFRRPSSRANPKKTFSTSTLTLFFQVPNRSALLIIREWWFMLDKPRCYFMVRKSHSNRNFWVPRFSRIHPRKKMLWNQKS